ncbi:MAG: amidohydrolase [Chloroflexi bacterium]|nr:amidohydrolase [Chloroflexota bacterium]
MARQYKLVSADGHVNPLPTFWKEYLPKRFQDSAPRLEQTGDGDFVVFEGKRTPFLIIGSLAGTDVKDYKVTGTVKETRPGGWEPRERLKDLAIDDVDAEVLYGGGPLSTSDPEMHLASYRAYNTWLSDFCSQAPDQLLGMAYIPIGNVEKAIDELRFAAGRGLRGVVIPAYPPDEGATEGGAIMPGDPNSERSYGDPEFEPFWQAAVELNMPLNVHLGARRADLRPHRFLPAMTGSKLALGEVVAVFVFSGILQRHPGLKFVSVESGVGWFAFCAQYMDHVWDRHRYWTESPLEERPSFYMDRQVYGTFLDDKVGVQLRNVAGAHNIMWSSDYPHSETTWPNSWKMIEEHFVGVPEDEKQRIICGNVVDLYQLG